MRETVQKVEACPAFCAAYAKEPLNQSAAALSGSFAPTCRFENLEIHKVFLQFPNLNLETKPLADHSCDLIRGSLESVKKLEVLFIAPTARQILHETAQRACARCECA